MVNNHFLRIFISFVGIVAVSLVILATAGYYEVNKNRSYAGQAPVPEAGF